MVGLKSGNNLNDILIFVRVVESRGISAAASVLRMSASHVSRRLRALEEDMGVQLIARSTRYVSLTDAGNVFYQKCAPALALLGSAQNETAELSGKPKGTLRIHAAAGIGQGLVAEAAAAFKKDHPDVNVVLMVDYDRENLMRDGYDIVVKTSDVADSSLVCQNLGPLRHLVVASPAYLQEYGRPQTPQGLVDHNCLLLYGRRPPGDWRFINAGGEYIVRVSGSFHSTNAYAVSRAAAAGVGIARLPEYVLEDHSPELGLEVIFDDCVAIARNVKAFYPRSAHVPAKVKTFLNYLRAADERRLERTAFTRSDGGVRSH